MGNSEWFVEADAAFSNLSRFLNTNSSNCHVATRAPPLWLDYVKAHIDDAPPQSLQSSELLLNQSRVGYIANGVPHNHKDERFARIMCVVDVLNIDLNFLENSLPLPAAADPFHFDKEATCFATQVNELVGRC